MMDGKGENDRGSAGAASKVGELHKRLASHVHGACPGGGQSGAAASVRPGAGGGRSGVVTTPSDSPQLRRRHRHDGCHRPTGFHGDACARQQGNRNTWRCVVGWAFEVAKWSSHAPGRNVAGKLAVLASSPLFLFR